MAEQLRNANEPQAGGMEVARGVPCARYLWQLSEERREQQRDHRARAPTLAAFERRVRGESPAPAARANVPPVGAATNTNSSSGNIGSNGAAPVSDRFSSGRIEAEEAASPIELSVSEEGKTSEHDRDRDQDRDRGGRPDGRRREVQPRAGGDSSPSPPQPPDGSGNTEAAGAGRADADPRNAIGLRKSEMPVKSGDGDRKQMNDDAHALVVGGGKL